MAKKRKYTTEELTGKQMGAYTLMEHFTKNSRAGRNQHWWVCKCVCGKIVERAEARIIHNKGQRCSCNMPKKKVGKSSKKWKGCGEISGSYFSEIRLNARQRKVEFTITVNEIWEMFLTQEGKCALTGVPIHFNIKENDGIVRQTASLDRIDSKKGYTIDNVWWVHKDVNRVKNAYSLPQLVDICYRIVERFPKEIRDEEWVYQKTAKVN